MSDHFSDDQIDAIRRQADDLLARLTLSAEEREWAEAQAKVIFGAVTAAYLQIGDEQFGRLRGMAVAGAVAFALITTNEWAMKLDKDFPHSAT